MATPIVVPEMGESIVDATITRWLKKEGDPVAVGDILLELETEKVNLEVGSQQSGVLMRIDRQAGQDVKVGEVIGMIESAASEGGDGVKRDGVAAAQPICGVEEPRATPAAPPASEAQRGAEEAAMDKERGRALADEEQTNPPNPQEAPTPTQQSTPQPGPPPTTRSAAAPVVEKVESLEAPPAAPSMPGFGQEAAVAGASASPVVPAGPEGAERGVERVRMSRRRRTIARNLVQVHQTAAMLTTFNEIDMSGVMALRERHKDDFKASFGVSLGISSFFVKAVASVLKEHPIINAEVQGEEIVYKHFYDIGLAVDSPEGLVVPVLRDADRLSFGQIEQAIKGFGKKAKEGTLALDDLRGGTFTITNGGVYGSLFSTPILNLPQVAILGLHKIEARPVAVQGQVVIHPMMYVALTYDHRVVDGREAVQFLVAVKRLIEDPGALLLMG